MPCLDHSYVTAAMEATKVLNCYTCNFSGHSLVQLYRAYELLTQLKCMCTPSLYKESTNFHTRTGRAFHCTACCLWSSVKVALHHVIPGGSAIQKVKEVLNLSYCILIWAKKMHNSVTSYSNAPLAFLCFYPLYLLQHYFHWRSSLVLYMCMYVQDQKNVYR